MQHSKLMRAIVFRDYGDPQKVMELVEDCEIPKPNKNEVLVKIKSMSKYGILKFWCKFKYWQ